MSSACITGSCSATLASPLHTHIPETGPSTAVRIRFRACGMRLRISLAARAIARLALGLGPAAAVAGPVSWGDVRYVRHDPACCEFSRALRAGSALRYLRRPDGLRRRLTCGLGSDRILLVLRLCALQPSLRAPDGRCQTTEWAAVPIRTSRRFRPAPLCCVPARLARAPATLTAASRSSRRRRVVGAVPRRHVLRRAWGLALRVFCQPEFGSRPLRRVSAPPRFVAAKRFSGRRFRGFLLHLQGFVLRRRATAHRLRSALIRPHFERVLAVPLAAAAVIASVGSGSTPEAGCRHAT